MPTQRSFPVTALWGAGSVTQRHSPHTQPQENLDSSNQTGKRSSNDTRFWISRRLHWISQGSSRNQQVPATTIIAFGCLAPLQCQLWLHQANVHVQVVRLVGWKLHYSFEDARPLATTCPGVLDRSPFILGQLASPPLYTVANRISTLPFKYQSISNYVDTTPALYPWPIWLVPDHLGQ